MKYQLALLNLVLAAVTFVHSVPISHDEIMENSAKGLHLLQITEDGAPVWKSDDEELEMKRKGINFFDVTETYEVELELQKEKTNGGASTAATFPAPSHQSEVQPLLSQLSTSNMQSYLSSLTAFNNRYYKAQTGADASAWILSKVKSIISGRSDITASAFTHSWVQPSTIVKIAGTKAGRAPGADDDGTGTVNLIEALRVLVASGFKPSTPLEFHWYSGEEAGLLGSNAIATSYKSAGIQVKAFMELDMSGYFAPGSKEVMALEADYIDSGLNNFLKQLITMYSRIPYTMDIPCGYACSDHASWYKQGYPSSFPYEAVTGDDDPQIHSSGDTTSVNGFSWAHSLEFAKMAVAFAYEMTV
ncbi:hypothetical protein NP233_g6352 [Leucocoprinus birnbaumii]|uniref:Peptide hydrolase n=1 Tax=Leucocoprinus birnbaumii TaxID=56174 RepID=A0AAD5VSD2_9AGAR|nr:hypothetical protein NP233_g6352 [Leucocoprinus birnbaumii]